jgi:hypothetical protein
MDAALEDARQHLTRSAAALKAAATLDPAVAADLAIVHSVLVDQLDTINAMRRAA